MFLDCATICLLLVSFSYTLGYNETMNMRLKFRLNPYTNMVDSSLSGNVSLVNRLLLDAGLTTDLVNLWKDQNL